MGDTSKAATTSTKEGSENSQDQTDQPKPDVSELGAEELLPKLAGVFS